MNRNIRNLIIIVITIFLLTCSCRAQISDFKPGMTKQDVIKMWGKPGRITYPFGTEVWEYQFWTGTICGIGFQNDVIVATACQDPQVYYQYIWIRSR